MAKKLFKRLLSMVSAAAVGCSWAAGTALPAAFAEAPSAVDWQDDELIPVIVKVRGDAVLAADEAAEEGTDFIETPEADRLSDGIASAQDKAEAYIRSIYPELEIGFRYRLVYNGFSCTLPESVIQAAKASPYIEEITEDRTHITRQPEMTDAPQMSGMDPARNVSGYAGEGEVIAVIDTELNVDHSMFMPIEALNNKITKADLERLSDESVLSVHFDPEKAYVSSKIPFAYDYIDDTPYDLADIEIYHGTHVCGIAAGNRTKTPEGDDISGVAPDAQLVMMKVFEKDVDASGEVWDYCEDSVVAAAMEDAAALKADVINLSLGGPGEDYEYSVYASAISNLDNAGVIICASAGNEGDSYSDTSEFPNITKNVDTGTLNSPGNFPDVFSVASAENCYIISDALVVNGNEIRYIDGSAGMALIDLPGNTYEWEYVGLASEEDIASADLDGKIAVCDRGVLNFAEKAKNAKRAGAVGIIVCNNRNGIETDIEGGDDFPLVFISQEDGMILKANAGSPVTFLSDSHGRSGRTTDISSFSSVGVSGLLTLAPMITGVGGGVLSADYFDSYSFLSGTSMASPFIAGCCAVMDGYLKSCGIERTGSDKPKLIKNILMNTSAPYIFDMVVESPRKQGAGLANVASAMKDKVTATGNRGIAAIELGDKLGDSFGFNVDLTNFSDTDVTFQGIRLDLITDSWYLDEDIDEYCIGGSMALPTAAENYPSSVTVKAGQTSSIHFDVTIDPEFSRSQAEIFPNGYFIEGYISLYDSDNNPDVSVPVLGFSSDWAAVPIFDDGYYVEDNPICTALYGNITDIHQSFAENVAAMKGFLEENGLVRDDSFMFMDECGSFTDELNEKLETAMEAPEDIPLFISPDHDLFGDELDMWFMFVREASFNLSIIDETGNEVVRKYDNDCQMNYGMYSEGLDSELEELPDGKYTVCAEAYIPYPGAADDPQRYTWDIVIDRSDPKLSTEITEKDGKKILSVTVSDDNADGLYFAASDGKMSEDQETLLNRKAFESACYYSTLIVNDTEETLGASEPESAFIKKMGDIPSDELGFKYDIMKFVPLSEEGGTYEFDLTDCLDYEVTVIDRAFNYTTKKGLTDTPDSITDGTWWAQSDTTDRYIFYYAMSDKSMIMQQSDGTFEDVSIDFSGSTVTINHADGTAETGTYSWSDSSKLVVNWDNGCTETWKHNFYTPDQKFCFTNEELCDFAVKYYTEVNGIEPAGADVYSTGSELIGVEIYITNSRGDKVEMDTFEISRFTGVSMEDGLPLRFADYCDITPGCWVRSDWRGELLLTYMYFNEDGTGICISQADSAEKTFTYEHDGPSLSINYSNGLVENFVLSRYDPNIIDLYDGTGENSVNLMYSYDDVKYPVYDNNALIYFAERYYQLRNGFIPIVKVVNNSVYNTDIFLYDESGELLDKYEVEMPGTYATDLKGHTFILKDPDTAFYTPGDVDSDGSIDATDASQVLQVYAAIQTGETVELLPEEELAADVNNDEYIDANDASMILAYYSYTQTGGTDSIWEFVEAMDQ